MSFLLLKHVHVTCAALTGMLFVLRGWLMLREAPLLQNRYIRSFPHLVDSALLASAIGMLFVISLNPFEVPWLRAKIGLLLVYIGLGLVALRFGTTRRMRLSAWLAALLVFTVIVVLAVTKPPI